LLQRQVHRQTPVSRFEGQPGRKLPAQFDEVYFARK
jgi:hypothetical protein